MAEWDYGNDWGASYDPSYYYAGGSPTFDESGGYAQAIGPGLGWDFSSNPAYQQFTGWGDPTGVGSSGDTNFTGEGSGFGASILGALGSVGSFLGNNASWLGPLAAAGGSLAGGAMGSQASNEAARLQAAALNRGLDLQTAQWLQQQANQAPWLEAGQQALGHLRGRMEWAGPQQPGATPAISGANYALPSATPGWTPQTYQGPAGIDPAQYRYTPGQGPQAANYRYTPGQTPDAAAYRYTPGAVPTLQGAELLANDPGYQFRQEQARKALEASALAKGMGMSGATLGALQERSQDLASQEYGQAWNRASQQAQMREGWAQQASQLGFGQAEAASRLREQVNQIAAQQGWSQAQAEAAFREQMAQQASQQGFAQALAGQGQQFQQGLQAQQWNQGQQQAYDTDAYNRMLQQQQLRYGMDVTQNQTDYQRQQQAYQQQVAELTRQWNQFAGVAGTGQTAVGQLGTQGQAASTQLGSLLSQLGTAQGVGELGGALSWQRALGGATNNLTGLLAGLNR